MLVTYEYQHLSFSNCITKFSKSFFDHFYALRILNQTVLNINSGFQEWLVPQTGVKELNSGFCNVYHPPTLFYVFREYLWMKYCGSISITVSTIHTSDVIIIIIIIIIITTTTTSTSSSSSSICIRHLCTYFSYYIN